MDKGNILVVDDEKLIRWSLKEFLQQEGYAVRTAEDGKTALQEVDDGEFEIVLLDYQLPDLDGLQVLEKLRIVDPDLTVIMITSHSTIEHAVTALRSGANDYVAKPFRNEDIACRVEQVLETRRIKRELKQLRREQKERFGFDQIVGKSKVMKNVLDLVDRVLPMGEATVLLQGESGTGKDVLARAIHYGGPRGNGPFVNITCTALPDNLLESELFGHEKGAFTDARTQKKGLFEMANGGTLFLDEIGDMALPLQAKLLRFLEERAFRRVGGNKDIRVNLRVIAATNQDLNRLVEQGKFRGDLYFRLKVIPMVVPPLREREGDIPLLVEHFIGKLNREFKKSIKGLDPKLMRRFEEYHWPGNVRELKNTVERAMILSNDELLSAESLPMDLFEDSPGGNEENGLLRLTQKGLSLEELEKDLVCQALELTRGNQTRAGRLLGLNRDQIRYRVEKFHLKLPLAGGPLEASREA